MSNTNAFVSSMKSDTSSQRGEENKKDLFQEKKETRGVYPLSPAASQAGMLKTKRDIKDLVPRIEVHEGVHVAANFTKNYKENFKRQHKFFKGGQAVVNQEGASLKSSLKKGFKV